MFGMTNMPSASSPIEISELKLELVTESKTVKAKKVYNIGEGQLAFHF
ncbi:hypothetical protein [Paenibacillus faecalis]|nr:hypothetical protein [Paenibacillus faecalis]